MLGSRQRGWAPWFATLCPPQTVYLAFSSLVGCPTTTYCQPLPLWGSEPGKGVREVAWQQLSQVDWSVKSARQGSNTWTDLRPARGAAVPAKTEACVMAIWWISSPKCESLASGNEGSGGKVGWSVSVGCIYNFLFCFCFPPVSMCPMEVSVHHSLHLCFVVWSCWCRWCPNFSFDLTDKLHVIGVQASGNLFSWYRTHIIPLLWREFVPQAPPATGLMPVLLMFLDVNVIFQFRHLLTQCMYLNEIEGSESIGQAIEMITMNVWINHIININICDLYP